MFSDLVFYSDEQFPADSAFDSTQIMRHQPQIDARAAVTIELTSEIKSELLVDSSDARVSQHDSFGPFIRYIQD